MPASLTNIEFWGRYYFKLKILKEEQVRRLKLIDKVNSEMTNEKEVDWGDGYL